MYRLRKDESMYLGVDIGGTTGRVSAFAGLGDTAEIERVEFAVTQSPNCDFTQDFDNLVRACGELTMRRGQQIEGIGLALAGNVNPDRTMLTAAGNLGHWANQPVRDKLSAEFGCRVVLGNDAEAAAMAETLYGEHQGTDLWFIIWGTGIGGCLVRHVNGVPVPFAGEPGHQEVDSWSTQECLCGQYGCLETYCGGTGIATHYGKEAKDLSPEQWNRVVQWMEVGVRNLVTIQPVPLVIFGGGIANKQSPLLIDLEGILASDLCIVDAPKIRLSAFGESAGTVGALSLIGLD